MTDHLFYVPSGALAEKSPGELIVLDEDASRHAVKSLRLTTSDQILIADGTGSGGLANISAVDDPTAVHVQLSEIRHTAAPDPEIVLVQALAKGDRDLLAVQTCVELGIDAVIPWEAERSIVRLRHDKIAKSQAKWNSTILSAAQQARRFRLPRLEEPVRGTHIASLADKPGTAILTAHQDATESLKQVFHTRVEPRTEVRQLLIVVGPEGGISEAEIHALTAAGAHIALLGNNILRASTAGPAALTLLNDYLGRW